MRACISHGRFRAALCARACIDCRGQSRSLLPSARSRSDREGFRVSRWTAGVRLAGRVEYVFWEDNVWVDQFDLFEVKVRLKFGFRGIFWCKKLNT